MRFLLAVAVACTVVSTAASAEDATAGPVSPSELDWSGFYLGANLGYARGHISSSGSLATELSASVFVTPGTYASPDQDADLNGLTGGGGAGYNVQSGAFVFGIEADIQGSAQDAELSYTAPVVLAPTTDTLVELNRFGTVRGRVGWAFDRLLIYGTGGLAVAQADLTVTVASAGLPVTATDSDGQVFAGYTAGGGVEIAVADGWSVKGEYLYADFGDQDFAFQLTPTFSAVTTVSIDTHIVRLGLNHRF